MKWLVYFFVIFIAAVALGLLAYKDPGYVLISRGYTSLEMSLSLFSTLLVGSFILCYLLIRFSLRTWHTPEKLRQWRQQQRTKKARDASSRGLIELAEGHWRKAERALTKHVKFSDTPLLNYLSAARAAQKQHAHERRDHYLSMAHKSTPDADFAVELTQAELQMAHGQLEQSLATLMHLRSIAPKHPYVLLLLMQLYEKLQSWGDLKALLPLLQKNKLIDEKELAALSITVYVHLMRIAARQSTANMKQLWQQIPREYQHKEQLSYEYAQHLIKLKHYDMAELVLRDTLKREWSQILIYLYGLAKSAQSDKQLLQAETWLKSRENNPLLLLTLGRISLQCKLWGKARSYLEASIGNGPMAETYKELGQLLDQLDEKDTAADCYRQGLLMAAKNSDYQLPQIQPE